MLTLGSLFDGISEKCQCMSVGNVISCYRGILGDGEPPPIFHTREWCASEVVEPHSLTGQV